MAAEKPEVGLDVELRAHLALAVGAARLGDLADPVEHQHRRQRQLRVAGAEQFAAAAGEEILVAETVAPIGHYAVCPSDRASARKPHARLRITSVRSIESAARRAILPPVMRAATAVDGRGARRSRRAPSVGRVFGGGDQALVGQHDPALAVALDALDAPGAGKNVSGPHCALAVPSLDQARRRRERRARHSREAAAAAVRSSRSSPSRHSRRTWAEPQAASFARARARRRGWRRTARRPSSRASRFAPRVRRSGGSPHGRTAR